MHVVSPVDKVEGDGGFRSDLSAHGFECVSWPYDGVFSL